MARNMPFFYFCSFSAYCLLKLQCVITPILIFSSVSLTVESTSGVSLMINTVNSRPCFEVHAALTLSNPDVAFYDTRFKL